MVEEMLGMLTERKGAKFANIVYTAKGTGEKARFQLILGATTENLYKKDIVLLECWPAHTVLDRKAVAAILASRLESLRVGVGNNSKYVHQDTYIHIFPGVMVHKDTGALHLTGLVHSKAIIAAGTYKTVKSAPLTLAKKAIEKKLPSGRFRQFIFTRVERIAMNGETLEIV